MTYVVVFLNRSIIIIKQIILQLSKLLFIYLFQNPVSVEIRLPFLENTEKIIFKIIYLFLWNYYLNFPLLRQRK